MDSPTFDARRIEVAREEALGGRCSPIVIDAAYLAGQLLDEEGQTEVATNIKLPASDQHGNQAITETSIYLAYTDPGYREWVEIGVQSQDDPSNKLPVAILQDRSEIGECSIAVFEPTSPLSKEWADNIVVTKDDEAKPFLFEDGKFQYTAEAVSVLKDLLSSGDDVHVARFIELFKLEELARLQLRVSIPEEQKPELAFRVMEPQEFLRHKIAEKLGRMSLHDTVALEEVVKQGTAITDSYVIRSLLTKISPDIGQVNWSLQFGSQERPVGKPVEYLPPVVLLPGTGAGTEHFVQASGEPLLDEQSGLLEGLAKREGWRDIHQLPPGRLDGEGFTLNRSGEVEFAEDFEEASQELADYIAYFNELARCKPIGTDEARLFHRNVLKFQLKFVGKLDILDIGQIKLPSRSKETEWFLYGAFDLKAHIVIDNNGTGHSWRVFERAYNCSGSIVENAEGAFNEAYNLTMCRARGSRKAFSNLRGVNQDCVAEDCRDAFSYSGSLVTEEEVVIAASAAKNCDTAFSGPILSEKLTIKDCVAQNCSKAFNFVRKDRSARRELINNRWLSRPKNGKEVKKWRTRVGKKSKK